MAVVLCFQLYLSALQSCKLDMCLELHSSEIIYTSDLPLLFKQWEEKGCHSGLLSEIPFNYCNCLPLPASLFSPLSQSRWQIY